LVPVQFSAAKVNRFISTKKGCFSAQKG